LARRKRIRTEKSGGDAGKRPCRLIWAAFRLLLLLVSASTAGSGLPEVAVAEPDAAAELNRVGVELLKNGLPDQAISSFEGALRIEPSFPAALNNLGLAFAIQGQLEEAIAAYRKALEVDPNFREALSNLGNALTTKGQFDAAISSYRKALTLKPDPTRAAENTSNPTDAEIHFNLSFALLKAGRKQEAARELQAAERLDPKWGTSDTAPGQAKASRSAPRTARRYAVQVGAYEDRAKAEALAQELSQRYQKQVGIFPVEVRGKTLYRVRIHVESRAQAAALAERLPREQNLPAWIVPIK
jgi:tetratricopeptide (TPR) repeat protein